MQRWDLLARRLLAGVMACLLFSALFILLADDVVADRRDQFDRQLASWIRSHAGHAVHRVMQVMTDLASAPVVIAIWLLMVVWLARARRRRDAIVVAIAWPLGQGLENLIKVIVHRTRPNLGPGFAVFHGYSFPSGHTFSAVETYGLLAALIAARVAARQRRLGWGVAVLITVGVGYSRVVLGAHYPVDVLGSLLLGGAWLSAILITLSLADQRTAGGGGSTATESSPALPPAKHPPRARHERSSGSPSG